MSEQTDGGKLVELAADFTTWDTPTLAAQCRMQARENLDPEYSRFMEEVAARLASPPTDLKADNAALVDLTERAEALVKLGKATGSHTGHRLNIYQIAEELLAALQATEPRP